MTLEPGRDGYLVFGSTQAGGARPGGPRPGETRRNGAVLDDPSCRALARALIEVWPDVFRKQES